MFGIRRINVLLSILWLQGGRYEVRISIGPHIFLFSKTGPNEPPSQWILDLFPSSKEAWKWSWPHSTI